MKNKMIHLWNYFMVWGVCVCVCVEGGGSQGAPAGRNVSQHKQKLHVTRA